MMVVSMNMHSVHASSTRSKIVAANFAAGELDAKNVAIFADNASDYAKGLAKSFKETITKNGGTVVKEEAYVAKDTDFRTQLTNIKAANPDFIFIPGYYEEVGLIVKQAREMGITVPLMGLMVGILQL